MSWTEETNETSMQREKQAMEILISENSELKLKLEEAKSIMSEQSSIINELKNKQISLIQLKEMQETLRIKEQHLNQKDLDYDELKKKLTANPKGNYKLKADFWKIASPAFAIINDTTQSFTGGVKNLKYTDLRKVLDIIIQLRDEAQRTQKLCEDVYNKNQELLNGGLSTFELKIHDAKIKQKIEMECHKKYGRT